MNTLHPATSPGLGKPYPGVAPRIGRSVSLDQAAEILGVSRRTIYNRIRDGRLETIRTLGGSQRVLVDSMHRMFDRRRGFHQ
jgi:excisionase family DNA binding protein